MLAIDNRKPFAPRTAFQRPIGIPPVVHPQPLKHMRYPWKLKEDRVTIALGILTDNGVVIAADTQIGITNYLKVGQGKIYFAGKADHEGRKMSFAVSGAGTDAYIKHLQQDFLRFVIPPHTPQLPTHDGLEQQTASRIMEFHEKHVIPFSNYPSAERPVVSLVLGYYCAGCAKLWSSAENLLTESTSYAAVGIGAMYADIVLSKLFPALWPISMKVAVLLAAYVVQEVKAYIDGCGKDTDIICVGPYRNYFLNRSQTLELESHFDSISNLQAEIMRQSFMGPRASSGRDIVGSINDIANKLEDFWQKFNQSNV